MYKSRQIADWIIHKTHGNITHSKLQKLLYYCQAWHYTIFNEVLFDERIEAWAHGPVVPSQFSRFNNIDFFQNIKVKDGSNIEYNPKFLSKIKKALEFQCLYRSFYFHWLKQS